MYCLLQDIPILSLVDTGSAISILDREVAAKHDLLKFAKKTEKNKHYKAVNGTALKTLGKICLQIRFPNCPLFETLQEFIIIEGTSHNLVLGMDFFTTNKLQMTLQDNEKGLSLGTRDNTLNVPIQHHEIPPSNITATLYSAVAATSKIKMKAGSKNRKKFRGKRSAPSHINPWNIVYVNKHEYIDVSTPPPNFLESSGNTNQQKNVPMAIPYSVTQKRVKPSPEIHELESCLTSQDRDLTYIQEDILKTVKKFGIRPLTEQIMYIEVEEPIAKRWEGKYILLSPLPLPDDSLHIPRMVTRIRNNKICICIINLSRMIAFVGKNTILAKMAECKSTDITDWNAIQVNDERIPAQIISCVNREGGKLALEDLERKHPWLKELGIGEIDTEDKEGEMDTVQKHELYQILIKNEKAFSKSDLDIGLTDVAEAHIEVTTDKPVFTRQYPFSPKNREIAKAEVKKLYDAGVLEETFSEYNSPILLVRKKDSTYRICIDLRKINDITKPIQSAIPTFEKMLQLLAGNTFYTSLDIYSAYNQILLDKESRQYTAFSLDDSRYQYKTLPQGHRSSVAIFQHLMHKIFDSQYRNMCVYVDDVLLFNSDFDSHMKNLDSALGKLINAKLKLKTSKCQLFKRKIKYLGHIASAQGLSPDNDKIAAIQTYPIPTNRRAVRGYLGMCGYFRRFIKDFAEIAHPLTELTSEKVKFNWNDAAHSAYIRLKSALCSPPVLKHPEFDKPFILTTDASKYSIGACLSQLDENNQERAISFMSKKLSGAQNNYSAYDLEFLAVFKSLKYFRPYLFGAKFELRTDNSAICYLMSQSCPTTRHLRYVNFIQDFQFTITHKKGADNVVADYLSRNPSHKHNRILYNPVLNLLTKVTVTPDNIQEWLLQYREELGLKEATFGRPSIPEYDCFNPNNLCEQISIILTNKTSGAGTIRLAIADLLLKNKKYLETNEYISETGATTYIKRLKEGAPMKELEVKAVSSLLKCPIFYQTRENWRVSLPEFRSTVSDQAKAAPLGVIIQLKLDSHNNWIWENLDLQHTIPKDGDEVLVKSKQQRINYKKPYSEIENPNEATCSDSEDEECIVCTVQLTGRRPAKTSPRYTSVNMINAQEDAQNPIYIPSTKELIKHQQADMDYALPWLKFIKDGLKPAITKSEFLKYKDSVRIADDGVLVVETRDPETLEAKEVIVLPRALLLPTLRLVHDKLGHSGKDKCIAHIKQYFHRPHIATYVDRFIASCLECKSKKGYTSKPAKLQETPTVQDRYQVWAIDVVVINRKSSEGHNCIITMMDLFSRWVEASPQKSQTAEIVAQVILDNIVCRFGVPQKLLSDRGTNFMSNVIGELCKLLQISRTVTSPYRPQGNAKLERFHRFLKNCIKSRVNHLQDDWHKYVPFALLAYRSSVHKGTTFSPAYLHLGQNINLPLAMLRDEPNLPLYKLGMSKSDLVTEVAVRMADCREEYIKTMKENTRSNIIQANKQRKNTQEFKVNDPVLLRRPVPDKKMSEKLHRNYYGYFRIISKDSPVTYTIQEENGKKQYKAHFDNLQLNETSFRDDLKNWYEEGVNKHIEELVIEEVTPPYEHKPANYKTPTEPKHGEPSKKVRFKLPRELPKDANSKTTRSGKTY